MTKFILLLITSTFLLSNLSAQNTNKCGSHEILKSIEQKNPGYSKELNKIGNSNTLNKTRGSIIYIPVVVHVVYKNATENLSDSYITAQIDILNKTYARKNADTTNTRSIFNNIVGPVDVQFVLAQIKRVPTTVQGFTFDFDLFSGENYADDVKISNNGGSDAVIPTKNLNIWVCDITLPAGQAGELLGYAYPPPGLPNWGAGSSYSSVAVDGVVIDYIAFGGLSKLPLGASTYGLKGKTCVHEVGHYLGLRHIWGDDGGACQGDVGFEDDGITDTPHADNESNSDCNKTKNTCNQGTGDLPDMVENYMDYSSEGCQNAFTKGQSSFMYNVLTNIRTGIRVPTGIEENTYSTFINLFPNPTSESLVVNFSNLDYTNAVIEIKDITGKTIKTAYVNEKTAIFTVDGLSKFQNGLYIASISINNYKINKSFLINK